MDLLNTIINRMKIVWSIPIIAIICFICIDSLSAQNLSMEFKMTCIVPDLIEDIDEEIALEVINGFDGISSQRIDKYSNSIYLRYSDKSSVNIKSIKNALVASGLHPTCFKVADLTEEISAPRIEDCEDINVSKEIIYVGVFKFPITDLQGKKLIIALNEKKEVKNASMCRDNYRITIVTTKNMTRSTIKRHLYSTGMDLRLTHIAEIYE